MVMFDKNTIDENIKRCWNLMIDVWSSTYTYYFLKGKTLDGNYSDPGDKDITLAISDDLYELKVWCDIRNIKVDEMP